jgi:CHAT domain-containing protein
MALTMALLMFLSEPLVALARPAGSRSHQRTSTNAAVRMENNDSIDGETLLLEYLLGEQTSVLWAVTSDSVKLYELPGRAVIERAARRVYELLTARLPRDNETNLDAFYRAARSRSQFPAAAAELSQLILGPVANDLGWKRLLIVADGALHFIPFAILPMPRSDDQIKSRMVGQRHPANRKNRPSAVSDRQSPNPLILDHEIVNLPSASVLGMLRRRQQTRSASPKLLALLADPVFERDDPRFKLVLAGGTTAEQSDAGNMRGVATSATPWIRGRLTRLRFARQEADHILATLSPAEWEASLSAFDFAANQQLALSPELEGFRYLHFATHGLLDNERPELSGLALSLLDRDGRDQDGFLRLVEIYNLRLTAELVTLSACETGLGKQVSGEGIVGLAHGFLHAGASRVLVSLWKVDDRASARLMGRIYEGIFREKLSPAAALQKAQLSLWRDPATSDPFFWAAFVLHGEPR